MPDAAPVVVDASVVVEYLVDLGLADAATAVVRGAVEGDGELWVPDLVYPEVASAIARLERTRALAARDAVRAIEHLAGLPFQVAGTAPLLADAWRLRGAITLYDACYVVLAQRVGAPLVTADARLVRAMRARGLDARDLRRLG